MKLPFHGEANANDPTVADLVAGKVLELIKERALSNRIRNGAAGRNLFRDLSRARFVEPLRRRLRDDSLLIAPLQLEVDSLIELRTKQEYAAAAEAAAVFLIRIAKPVLPSRSGDGLYAAAVTLFKTCTDPALRVELALQLIRRDSEEFPRAVDLILREPGTVEKVREHYLEARAPSELLARIEGRWATQQIPDAMRSDSNRFRGLSPFLHASPAPGGSSQAVEFTERFASALVGDPEGRQERVNRWLKDVACSQRIYQWEFFQRNERGRYESKAGDLATLVDNTFFADLTKAWWSYVADYEPIPLGAPVLRSTTRNLPPRLEIEAHETLLIFRALLADLPLIAPADIHHRVAEQMHKEWRDSRRAGTLLIHDGELTYWTLRWFRCNQSADVPTTSDWKLPILRGARFNWSAASFGRVLEFLGLGLVDGSSVVLTPRWRSFLRWLELLKVDTNKIPLNTCGLEEIGKMLPILAPVEKEVDPVQDSRAPFLPLEVFLRANRPWPSHLVVTTVHAHRKRGSIVPLSFGFATLLGDLPFATQDEWYARSAGESNDGRGLFLSWLNNHCTLLSGIGMSLGVSSEMARVALREDDEWFDDVWGDTKGWFPKAAKDRVPPHKWVTVFREVEEAGSSERLDSVIQHLTRLTGLNQDFWRPDNDFWEEMKRLFGCNALAQGKEGRHALTLGGIWVLAMAYINLNCGGPLLVNGRQFSTSTNMRTDTVLPASADSERHYSLLSKLRGLFSEVFVRDEERRGSTVLDVHREDSLLWFDLDIPFYSKSADGEGVFWTSFLGESGRGGGATDAIKEVRAELERYRSERWEPAEIWVAPVGDPFKEKLRLGFRAGRTI